MGEVLFDSWLIEGAIYVAGVLTAIFAILKTRTAQGAIAWSISLLTAPLLAVPAYWILGRSRFLRQVIDRRRKALELEGVLGEARSVVAAHATPNQELTPKQAFYGRLAPHPISSGNRLDLLVDGENTFEAILSAIRQAKSYVLVEYFTIRDDAIGRELLAALVERAGAGVRCYVLYDDVGSRNLTRRYVRDLKAGGVIVSSFSSRRGLRRLLQLNFRNHRKIVVVDGERAFLGGLNVGDEYLGRDPEHSPWRDTHAAISGPAVLTVQQTFVEDWRWGASGEPLGLNWEARAIATSAGEDAGERAVVIPSGPADAIETGGLLFVHAIESARKRLVIATPYFVPDLAAVTALELAALRGVDIKILVPSRSDSRLADAAASTFMAELIPFGVGFYQWQEGFAHQKVALIDDQVALVGTANFDNRSFRLNFEITLAGFDERFVNQVADMLGADLERTERVRDDEFDKRSLGEELLCRIARMSAALQ